MIAVELGRHGITVNAYAPGPIVTAMREWYRQKLSAIQAEHRTWQSEPAERRHHEADRIF
jgi:NAD(P)-dependent dehydrogenase (short-subunit alcohol dehydrogenase family)